uniref:Uncharacterized protein n=1 Tax=Parascaris equorum TaxID=6256 RepID=A0A914SIQ5_PAREQ
MNVTKISFLGHIQNSQRINHYAFVTVHLLCNSFSRKFCFELIIAHFVGNFNQNLIWLIGCLYD